MPETTVQDAELLAMACAFEILPYDRHRIAPLLRWVKIEDRSSKGEPRSWAIVGDGTSNLSRDGEWEVEPSGSNKTEEFFGRCRWADLQEAIRFVRAHFEAYPSGYKDVPVPKAAQRG
jgi:hypothetical protein